MPENPTREKFLPSPRTWVAKFSDAFSGLWIGISGQKSFYVHIFFAMLCVILALSLRVTAIEGCVLTITIGLVFSLELLNTALEELSREVTDRFSESVDRCLKVASAAVLVSAGGSVVVGCLIFIPKVSVWLS